LVVERGCGKAQPQHVAGTQGDGNKVSAAAGLRHSRAPLTLAAFFYWGSKMHPGKNQITAPVDFADFLRHRVIHSHKSNSRLKIFYEL
jgi:hypothetical protein